MIKMSEEKKDTKDIVEKLAKALNDPKSYEDKEPWADLMLHGLESREQGLNREEGKERPTLSPIMIAKVKKLHQSQREALLAMTLEGLRGYWGDYEERLALVHWLCDHIYEDTKKLHYIHFPKALLDAIRHNAYLFDGEWTDGRIFRDGDRSSGLTGNLTYHLTGNDKIQQEGGWSGTYYECFQLCARRGGASLLSTMRDAYHGVLRFTSDCTFDDDFPMNKTLTCPFCDESKLCGWLDDPFHVFEDGNFKTWMCNDCYIQRDKEGTKKFEAEFKKRLKNGTLEGI